MNETDIVLPPYVKVGATIRIFYNPNNPNNKTIHVRAIVDDEYVVYRWWHRRKGWLYKVEWMYWFSLLEENGRIKSVRQGKKKP